MWTLFIIFFLPILYGQDLPKKRICVIGAGRSGLAAVKLVADQKEKFELVAFERNSDVGGLWIYRESPDLDEHGLPAHSGIYKNLRTNLPKELMVYPDYLKFESKDNRSFVSHEIFLEYMRNYTDHFQLRKYIKFDTMVSKVVPITGNDTLETETWQIDTKNLNTNESTVTTCDAVLVCTGHFSKPKIPEIPGIETFSGKVFHSRAYRRPENYTNQTVVVLGIGPSGIEIARDLSIHAKTVYASHRYSSFFYRLINFPTNVLEVRGVVAANGSALILKDNTTIIDVDTFILCTGYLHDYPFLDSSSDVDVDDFGVHPLDEDFINKNHPSMGFIGLRNFVNHAEICYDQMTRFLELLSEN